MARHRRITKGGRRGMAALGLSVVLTIIGGSSLGWAATHQESPPEPPLSVAAAARTTSPASTHASAGAAAPSAVATASAPSTLGAASPATSSASTPLHLAAATPVHVKIPAIGVDSPLQSLGLNPDGTLRTPRPGPHYDEPAWFNGSATPGQLGISVLEGHIDSAANGPSVFFRLGALHPGDTVTVARADGSVATFTVDRVQRFRKAQFPTDLVYGGGSGQAELRLITCGGPFDRSTGNYLDDTVVFAHLTATGR